MVQTPSKLGRVGVAEDCAKAGAAGAAISVARIKDLANAAMAFSLLMVGSIAEGLWGRDHFVVDVAGRGTGVKNEVWETRLTGDESRKN